MYPIVFNFEQLFTYGYYSGLISCGFELRKKHPVVFQNFKICNLKTMHNKETTEVHTDLYISQNNTTFKTFSGIGKLKNHVKLDFDILLQNVKHLHETNSLPVINRIIPNCPVSNQFILKTFSLLTHALYGKKKTNLL
ncbi:MAG: hypothetical protein IPN36_16705 [Bacteroidetes bacterium]|nr:hypothetical protein [Bacteroidota bacterium]